MKHDIVNFLRKSFPFLLTLALWRLSEPWINPAGILALIPVFYCSFIRPVPWFTAYAILFCFLTDYKFDTYLAWTMCYCIYYIIMNIQSVIDLTHTDKDGLFAFMIFIGITLFIIALINISVVGILGGIWCFVLTCALYLPTAKLIKVVCHD